MCRSLTTTFMTLNLYYHSCTLEHTLAHSPLCGILSTTLSTFHLSPRLCPPTAGCSPPPMPPIVLCCFPVPGGSLLPCYIVLPSSTWSSPWFLPSLWSPLCAAFAPPIVLHSCYMSGPSPLSFQCVFFNVRFLCSFPDL